MFSKIQNDENTRLKKKFDKFDDSSSTSSDEDETDEMAVGSANEDNTVSNSGPVGFSSKMQANEPFMADEEIQKKMLSARDFIKPNGDNNEDDSNDRLKTESARNTAGFNSEDSQQSMGMILYFFIDI